MPKRLIIDLDHTICTPQENSDQSTDRSRIYKDAEPIAEVVAQIRQYKMDGFQVVIHTSRNMRTYGGDADLIRLHTLPGIVDWLQRHNIPYDDIVIAKPWCGYEGFYVDDRAVRPSEFAQLSYEQINTLLARERK